MIRSLAHDRVTPGLAALLCLAGSAALLAGAHLFQAAGYAPCPLCLQQREVHWLALAIGAAALGLYYAGPVKRLGRVMLGVLALAYLGSAALAGYHAGVEYHWWQGPPCEAGQGMPVSAADLLTALETPTRAVPCDQAAWRMLGISMAGYNFLASLGLMGLALAGALVRARSEAAAPAAEPAR